MKMKDFLVISINEGGIQFTQVRKCNTVKDAVAESGFNPMNSETLLVFILDSRTPEPFHYESVHTREWTLSETGIQEIPIEEEPFQ